MSFFAPTSGSVLDAVGTLPSSSKAAIWLQIVAGTDEPASAALYEGTASAVDEDILVLKASASLTGPWAGPIVLTDGGYLGNLDNGCVNYLVRPTSR